MSVFITLVIKSHEPLSSQAFHPRSPRHGALARSLRRTHTHPETAKTLKHPHALANLKEVAQQPISIPRSLHSRTLKPKTNYTRKPYFDISPPRLVLCSLLPLLDPPTSQFFSPSYVSCSSRITIAFVISISRILFVIVIVAITIIKITEGSILGPCVCA